jgi:hypothetical protein
MGSKSQFATRQKANTGVKMFLIDPFTGKETKDWVLLLGRDSDVCRAADLEKKRNIQRAMSEVDMTDKIKREAVLAEIDAREPDEVRDQIATLVIGWSFDEPFSREAVLDFLVESPQVADAIDAFTASRVRFFGAGSGNSDNTQNQATS